MCKQSNKRKHWQTTSNTYPSSIENSFYIQLVWVLHGRSFSYGIDRLAQKLDFYLQITPKYRASILAIRFVLASIIRWWIRIYDSLPLHLNTRLAIVGFVFIYSFRLLLKFTHIRFHRSILHILCDRFFHVFYITSVKLPFLLVGAIALADLSQPLHRYEYLLVFSQRKNRLDTIRLIIMISHGSRSTHNDWLTDGRCWREQHE